jgi:hypothetical protein
MNVTSFALFYRSAVFTGSLLHVKKPFQKRFCSKHKAAQQRVTFSAARYRIIQRQGLEFIVKNE